MKNLKKTIIKIFQKVLLYEKFEKNHYKNFSKIISHKIFKNYINKNCAI